MCRNHWQLLTRSLTQSLTRSFKTENSTDETLQGTAGRPRLTSDGELAAGHVHARGWGSGRLGHNRSTSPWLDSGEGPNHGGRTGRQPCSSAFSMRACSALCHLPSLDDRTGNNYPQCSAPHREGGNRIINGAHSGLTECLHRRGVGVGADLAAQPGATTPCRVLKSKTLSSPHCSPSAKILGTRLDAICVTCQGDTSPRDWQATRKCYC